MLPRGSQHYLDTLKIKVDVSKDNGRTMIDVGYLRPGMGMGYGLTVLENGRGFSIEGEVQTVDELTYMVARLAAAVKGADHEQKVQQYAESAKGLARARTLDLAGSR